MWHTSQFVFFALAEGLELCAGAAAAAAVADDDEDVGALE